LLGFQEIQPVAGVAEHLRLGACAFAFLKRLEELELEQGRKKSRGSVAEAGLLKSF